MTPAKAWLPDDCLGSARVAARIRAITEEWGREWFRRDAWLAADRFSRPDPVHDMPVLRQDGRIVLLGDGRALLALALGALGRPVHKDHPPRDLRLLRRLGGAILDDLAARLGTLVGSMDPGADRDDAGSQGGWHLAIGPAGGLVLRLAQDEVVALARSAFPSRATPSRLDPPRSATRQVELTTAALLGTVPLSLSQLSRLETGDILLLDTAAGAPVELLLDDRRTRRRFALTQSVNAMTLTLEGND